MQQNIRIHMEEEAAKEPPKRRTAYQVAFDLFYTHVSLRDSRFSRDEAWMQFYRWTSEGWWVDLEVSEIRRAAEYVARGGQLHAYQADFSDYVANAQRAFLSRAAVAFVLVVLVLSLMR